MTRTKIAALGLLLCATTARAGDFWMTVGQTETGGIFAAVDVTSIVAGGVEKKAWTYIFTVKNDQLVSMTAMREHFRCAQKEKSLLQWAEYDVKTLSPIRSRDEPGISFSAPLPGTLPQSVMEFVCAYGDSTAPAVGGFSRVSGTDLVNIKTTILDYLDWLARGQPSVSAPSAERPRNCTTVQLGGGIASTSCN